MQEKRKVKHIWLYIFITAVLIYFIGFSLKLSFIDPQFHFCFKMCLFIIFVISLCKSVFKNIKPLKYMLIVFAAIFIARSTLYHLFFEYFLYVTVIDLNGPKIAVQEHSMYDEYSIYFYKVKYGIFKQPLMPYICLDYPAFHTGNYRVVYFNDTEVVFEYNNPHYDFPQRVTVNY